jgi:hypothetical protein
MIGPGRAVGVRAACCCLALVMLAATTACGRAGSVGSGDQAASAARTASPSAPTVTPSIPAGWQTYSDEQYGFSIAYPVGFTFKQEGGAFPVRGWLIEYRAVDTRFLSGYPTGQVEMGVYDKDADTLTAWVRKHSDATCGMPNGTGFFWNVTNLTVAPAAGRDAVSFDDDTRGCEGPQATDHFVVFFLGSNHIFRFSWWSSDPAYIPTVQAIAQTMLSSFSG